MAKPNPNAETTALLETESAPVKYNPYEQVGSAKSLKGMLEQYAPSLANLLPKHVTPERLMKTMLTAANRNPDILRCTQASVIEAVSRAGELGLDMSGTLGEAYPVPFRNKIKIDGQDRFVHQLTMIIGYRGLAKLARQSGEIDHMEAEPVYENDHFVYQKGSDFKLLFTPTLKGDRGNLQGFYCYVRLKDGGEQADYMTVEEVERVRQMANSKNSPAWNNHFSEMGRKTVFRRAAKWLPLSAEKYQTAIEIDNADYTVEDVTEMVPMANGDKTQALADRLTSQASLPAGEPEPEVEGKRAVSADMVEELKALCSKSGLSWQNDVEDFFEGPIEELVIPGKSGVQVAEIVAAHIRKYAKTGK